ncbi:hypothetical protein VTK26DRAFT_4905 [Humicola hyalothermophila]
MPRPSPPAPHPGPPPPAPRLAPVELDEDELIDLDLANMPLFPPLANFQGVNGNRMNGVNGNAIYVDDSDSSVDTNVANGGVVNGVNGVNENGGHLNNRVVRFNDNVAFINENPNAGGENGARINGINGVNGTVSSSSSDSDSFSIPPEAQELFDAWSGVWASPQGDRTRQAVQLRLDEQVEENT